MILVDVNVLIYAHRVDSNRRHPSLGRSRLSIKFGPDPTPSSSRRAKGTGIFSPTFAKRSKQWAIWFPTPTWLHSRSNRAASS